MKFFATAAVIQVVSAGCGKNPGTGEPFECEKADKKQCVKYKVLEVDSAVFKPQEGNAYLNRKMKVGRNLYICLPE